MLSSDSQTDFPKRTIRVFVWWILAGCMLDNTVTEGCVEYFRVEHYILYLFLIHLFIIAFLILFVAGVLLPERVYFASGLIKVHEIHSVEYSAQCGIE